MHDAPFATTGASVPSDHSKITALIAGYYGSGNAGDEAILECMLGALRAQIPGLDPVVVSAAPASTAAAYGVRPVSRPDKPTVVAAVRDCDLVLLGGGGLLQDYWPMDIGNLFSDPAAHPSYATYAALAALYDKPLILYAIGVGPLSTAVGRLHARMICDRARLITVRDAESKALLEEVGVEASRIHVTADPAFRLTAPPSRLRMESPVLGVALRNWNIGVDPALWEFEISAALDAFLDQSAGSILFLPFDHGDPAIAHRIRSRLRSEQRTRVLEAAGNASQLASAISSCRLVLAMRYHAALFAIRYGIPVAGLAYDPKVRHLLTAAGCEDYIIDIATLRADRVTALIARALHHARLPPRSRSLADQLSEAASQTALLVANDIARDDPQTPPPSATRAWLDELTAAVSSSNNDAFAGLEIVKRAIAERRRQAGPATCYDIVCFPGIEWEFRWMRAQQLMSQFADRGHRVFFVSITTFLPPDGARFAVRRLRANVWEVSLAVPQAVDVYSGLMPDDVRRAILDDISALAREFAIGRAVSMLHLPTWTPAAQILRTRFGWPIVYDCMDDWSGFAWMPQPLIDREVELVRDADLVVATAQRLWDKWSPLNRRTILARNAADIAHFQSGASSDAGIDLPSSHPIVGFFGAIDSWFDVELLLHAATERPDYFFALIGGVFDAPVERLQQLPNVRFFGHQPYAILPAWLRRFEACIIPFKINAVTNATDPVKFYEYLAQGKPIVATRMPELELYHNLLYLADGPDDFLRLLDAAVTEHDTQLRERRLAAASENTWAARCQLIDSAFQPFLAAAPPLRRILFACPVLILGGVEVTLQNRAAELLRRGWQVRLIAQEDAGGQVLFQNSGIDSHICSSDTELSRELMDFQPDWIVSLDAPFILPIARQTAPQAAIVYEVHSPYPHTQAQLLDRNFFTGVCGILVPSRSQEVRIRSLLQADVPIEIVLSPLSPQFFEDPVLDNEALPHSPGHPIVLWVGRLDSLKNWRAFLGLAAGLRDRTDAEFHLISGGPFDETEGAELERVVANSGRRLSWMREVEPARMPDIYRSVAQSGGCLVSTSANESFGRAVVEAMACRCPVVVPDVVGLRDLVRHGETGRLYPPATFPRPRRKSSRPSATRPGAAATLPMPPVNWLRSLVRRQPRSVSSTLSRFGPLLPTSRHSPHRRPRPRGSTCCASSPKIPTREKSSSSRLRPRGTSPRFPAGRNSGPGPSPLTAAWSFTTIRSMSPPSPRLRRASSSPMFP